MVPHQIRFDQVTRCVVIYFDLHFLRPTITRPVPVADLARMAPELTPFAWQNHVDFQLTDDQRRRVEQAIATMIEQDEGRKICASEIIRAELSIMMASICQDYESQLSELSRRRPSIGRDSSNMRRIADFIGENYQHSPSLSEAAGAVGLSKSRLCVLLRQYTGTTFNQLIREMRIEDACERLVLTNDAIGQIAYNVGFSDDKYFLRAFKSAVGMTPSAYRQKNSAPNAEKNTTSGEQRL
jgi:AraC-like DNA-binding protein